MRTSASDFLEDDGESNLLPKNEEPNRSPIFLNLSTAMSGMFAVAVRLARNVSQLSCVSCKGNVQEHS